MKINLKSTLVCCIQLDHSLNSIACATCQRAVSEARLNSLFLPHHHQIWAKDWVLIPSASTNKEAILTQSLRLGSDVLTANKAKQITSRLKQGGTQEGRTIKTLSLACS